MSIILLEAPDPRQLRESTGELIAVEHTKVSHPQGVLPPPPRSVVKNMRLWMRRGRGEGRSRKGRAWVSQEELAAAANVVVTVYQFRVKLVVHKKYASCSNTVAPT